MHQMANPTGHKQKPQEKSIRVSGPLSAKQAAKITWFAQSKLPARERSIIGTSSILAGSKGRV